MFHFPQENTTNSLCLPSDEHFQAYQAFEAGECSLRSVRDTYLIINVTTENDAGNYSCYAYAYGDVVNHEDIFNPEKAARSTTQVIPGKSCLGVCAP